MFNNFLLKISSGRHLTTGEQEDVIKYVLSNLWKYPKAQTEVTLLLDDALEKLSPKTMEILQALGEEWLGSKYHKK